MSVKHRIERLEVRTRPVEVVAGTEVVVLGPDQTLEETRRPGDLVLAVLGLGQKLDDL